MAKEKTMLEIEIEGARVRELARTEHWHRGPACRFEDIARHVPHLPAHFVAVQAELAGFPVWSSAPDEALRG